MFRFAEVSFERLIIVQNNISFVSVKMGELNRILHFHSEKNVLPLSCSYGTETKIITQLRFGHFLSLHIFKFCHQYQSLFIPFAD